MNLQLLLELVGLLKPLPARSSCELVEWILPTSSSQASGGLLERTIILLGRGLWGLDGRSYRSEGPFFSSSSSFLFLSLYCWRINSRLAFSFAFLRSVSSFFNLQKNRSNFAKIISIQYQFLNYKIQFKYI